MGLSYGMLLSCVAIVISPVNPSCLSVSAHITDDGPENYI